MTYLPIWLERVIRIMYEKSTSKIITQGIESSSFEIRSGVRQGDVWLPLLFIIFMEKCLRDVQALLLIHRRWQIDGIME